MDPARIYTRWPCTMNSTISLLAQWVIGGIIIFATGLLPLSITSRKRPPVFLLFSL